VRKNLLNEGGISVIREKFKEDEDAFKRTAEKYYMY